MPQKPLFLVVLGRQGSGKGTQCEMLAEAENIVHISTGEMLRSAGDTELGKKAKTLMEAGELVGDDLMCELVAERLSEDDVAETGAILDGFPRNPIQAEALQGILEGLGCSLNLAINIEVEEDLAIKRMLGRGRHDDTLEAISRRLEIYEEQTQPLIEWFNQKGLLVNIDGSGTEAEVYELFSAAINNAVNNAVSVEKTQK